ncbi:hypothetical protein B0H13DRAFT_2452409 [Mycena leptocephala]|jgi:hypothetical protein|nr:hypothetical protein B0H13DRAFT_2452409 [Mycena leptocephala]
MSYRQHQTLLLVLLHAYLHPSQLIRGSVPGACYHYPSACSIDDVRSLQLSAIQLLSFPRNLNRLYDTLAGHVCILDASASISPDYDALRPPPSIDLYSNSTSFHFACPHGTTSAVPPAT